MLISVQPWVENLIGDLFFITLTVSILWDVDVLL